MKSSKCTALTANTECVITYQNGRDHNRWRGVWLLGPAENIWAKGQKTCNIFHWASTTGGVTWPSWGSCSWKPRVQSWCTSGHSLDTASKPVQRGGEDTHLSLLYSYLTTPPLTTLLLFPHRKIYLTAKDDLLHSFIRMLLENTENTKLLYLK